MDHQWCRRGSWKVNICGASHIVSVSLLFPSCCFFPLSSYLRWHLAGSQICADIWVAHANYIELVFLLIHGLCVCLSVWFVYAPTEPDVLFLFLILLVPFRSPQGRMWLTPALFGHFVNHLKILAGGKIVVALEVNNLFFFGVFRICFLMFAFRNHTILFGWTLWSAQDY